jgi:anti-sigma factor RsiW
MTDPYEIPCRLFVEMLTDYLEGALDAADVARVDAHLGVCPPCVHVLEQFRETIGIVGALREDDVDGLAPDVRSSLMDAFKQAHLPGR